MKARRGVLSAARLVTGALVAGGCVFAVVAGAAAPLPEVHNTPAVTTVTPTPGDTVLVCNGSFRALGRDSTRADSMVSAASPSLTVDRSQTDPEARAIEMQSITGGEGAQSLTGVVANRTAPLVSAAESVIVSAEDLYGFAATPCREPSMTSWLVGGDVSVGASDIIVLTNPGDVPTTAQLDVYGESRSAGSAVIPPQTQVSLPLASLASGMTRPVVQVTSSAVPIRASLQSALIRTLDPVGIDMQDGVAGPQARLTVLGVRAFANPGDDASGVVLRMLSPETDARAVVRVRAATETAVTDEVAVDLTAAVPSEITLSGLAPGIYDIDIDASAPIVAAVRQSAVSGTRADFAWMTPAPEIADPRAFSVPRGPAATLFIRNPGSADVTVQLSGSAAEETLTVPAGATVSVSLRPGGSSLLSPSGPVHAAVSMSGGDDDASLAGWPLISGAATQQPITVYP